VLSTGLVQFSTSSSSFRAAMMSGRYFSRISAITADIQVRINKGTLRSQKRKYRRTNEFRICLHFSENSCQSIRQLAFIFKVSIMGSVLPSVLPESFRGIQFRRILGQVLYFQPVSIGLHPALHERLLMIGGVIVNENCTLPPIASGQSLQKGQVGFCIEYAVPLIMKPRFPQLDGTEDLDALACPGYGNLRRMSDSAPGGVQGRILTEAGFIGKD